MALLERRLVLYEPEISRLDQQISEAIIKGVRNKDYTQ